MVPRALVALCSLSAACALTDFNSRSRSANLATESVPYLAAEWRNVSLDAPLHEFHTATELTYVERDPNRTLSPVSRRLGDTAPSDAELRAVSPLYMGIGTHYAHVYVGTPAQRVSVIVDTGSHHTAFPCKGCKSCGQHTDPYFEPAKSSTLKYLSCSECVAGAHCVTRHCQMSQSYTEGSSWKADQMQDQYYVGGDLAGQKNSEGEWVSTPFVFGCQTYETGLFRTQKADGIMGMSMHAQTLVPTMAASKKIRHNVFSLCFKQGGGTMALGGVDTRRHLSPMQMTSLKKASGWFTVDLQDILMDGRSIGSYHQAYATGKGTIVDSGTTDTYLPRRCAEGFKRAWDNAMGKSAPKYGNTKMTFTPDMEQKLPTLTFVFGNGVKVDVKPESWLERVGGKLVPRVYLTESTGTVLGANFMQDQDVYFDAENSRIGFAQADCGYATSTIHASKPVLSVERSAVEAPENDTRLSFAAAPPAEAPAGEDYYASEPASQTTMRPPVEALGALGVITILFLLILLRRKQQQKSSDDTDQLLQKTTTNGHAQP